MKFSDAANDQSQQIDGGLSSIICDDVSTAMHYFCNQSYGGLEWVGGGGGGTRLKFITDFNILAYR